MNITPILTELEAERRKIDQAITVLKSLPSSPTSRKQPTLFPKVDTIDRRRLPMSEVVKRKISAASKARWRRIKAQQAA